MGTRSEIYIRNSMACVGLWKHWDGYPDYMVPMFKEFLKYAFKRWRGQAHWLTYPEDMAALLIAWYDRVSIRELRKIDKKFPINVDIRPLFGVDGKKMICDAEYAWVIDLPEPITINNFMDVPDELTFRIRGYRLEDWNGLNPIEIEKVARGEELDGPRCEKVVDEEVTFRLRKKTVALA
mgnify:CR=1 FL=1